MPKNLRMSLVDAFTTTPLGGNPCAVIFGSEVLSDSEMLAIAKEMNQSETAFVMPSKTCDIKARYFTPEKEIPLAGHPTIATFTAALEVGLLKMPAGKTEHEFSLELNEGAIKVEVHGTMIRMFQRKPIFGEIHDPQIVMPMFGLATSDLLPGACIQTVSTGTKQLMVPVKSLESLKKLQMKESIYREYRERTGFFSPHLFCLTEGEAQTFARHLGVAPDTAEDAFTGSATGGMACFLWKHGFLPKPKFIAEQGHWMNRPGRAYVEVLGPREDIQTVIVAGNAVTVLRGEMKLV